MRIIRAVIVVSQTRPDKISLFTDLPYAMHPYEGEQSLDFDAAHDTGVEYVKKNFPNIPYKCIDIRSKKFTFSE